MWDSNDSLNRLSMLSMAGSFYDCVETAVFVCRILNSSDSTVSLMKRIFTAGDVTFTGFFVGVDVAGVMVFYSILKFVFGWGLKRRTLYRNE